MMPRLEYVFLNGQIVLDGEVLSVTKGALGDGSEVTTSHLLHEVKRVRMIRGRPRSGKLYIQVCAGSPSDSMRVGARPWVNPVDADKAEDILTVPPAEYGSARDTADFLDGVVQVARLKKRRG